MSDEKLLEKIRGLAPDEIDEVENFIDTLRSQRSSRPILGIIGYDGVLFARSYDDPVD